MYDCQIFTFYFLRITLTNRSLGDVDMHPVIGVVASNVKRFKQGFEFIEYLILALAKLTVFVAWSTTYHSQC